MFDTGTGVSLLADYLVTAGILEGSTPPGVGTAIAGILYVEKGLMNYVADGCGAKLNVYITMVPAPTAGFHYWDSQ
jgi:hypothetical protein